MDLGSPFRGRACPSVSADNQWPMLKAGMFPKVHSCFLSSQTKARGGEGGELSILLKHFVSVQRLGFDLSKERVLFFLFFPRRIYRIMLPASSARFTVSVAAVVCGWFRLFQWGVKWCSKSFFCCFVLFFSLCGSAAIPSSRASVRVSGGEAAAGCGG